MHIAKLAAIAAVALAFGLAVVPSAQAQTPNVQIDRLECVDADEVSGNQELVVIRNVGDAAQQLFGWQLQSDPNGSEVFDLSVMGALPVGGSNFIQSGPSASGIFVWTTDEVFRDGDSTDYARIVDDTGAVVDEVNCPGAAQQPSPTPSPGPTPTPEATPPADVPNGGGVPPVSGGALSSLIMVLSGGSMTAAGLATLVFPWLRRRESPAMASPSPRAQRQTVAMSTGHAQRTIPRGWMVSAVFGAGLVGLAAVLALLVVRRSGH